MGTRLRVSGFCLKPAYLKEVFCYVRNAPTNQKWLDTNHSKKSNKMAWNIMKMKAKRRAANFHGLVVMALSLRINEAESASSGPDSTRKCGRRDPRSHARGAFKPFLYKCSGPHTVTESFLLRLSAPPELGRAIAIRQPHDHRSTENWFGVRS